jgi:hypothetical protein
VDSISSQEVVQVGPKLEGKPYTLIESFKAEVDAIQARLKELEHSSKEPRESLTGEWGAYGEAEHNSGEE